MTTGYDLLTGVGRIYIAPQGTAFPALIAAVASPWRDLGETEGGVKVAFDDKLEEKMVDQETGPVKVWRTEEHVTIETKLATATLENLADVLGVGVVTVPASAGVAATRAVPLYAGFGIKEFSYLFRGFSAYGDFPAQYELIRGYFGGASELDHQKGASTPISCKFFALINLNAGGDAEKFGRLIHQTGAAL